MKLRDDERPPINSANGQILREFSLADRFRQIYEQNLWLGKNSVSGPGSGEEETVVIRRELPLLLERLGSRILLDAPCGDASWISNSDLSMDYIGIDIVPGLISQLSNKAASGAITGKFLVADITNSHLPSADTVLCRDCLVHFSFQNIYLSLNNFKRAGARWIVTTTFTDLGENKNCEDGDWRPLNFEKPPFNWNRPEDILVEGCSLGNGGWRDKSLGVWRMDDIYI